MKNVKTLENEILINLEKEYNKFKQKTEDSLILAWFKSKGVDSPVESKDSFMYDVHFIGNKNKPKYTGYAVIIYPDKSKFSKCFIGEMSRGRRHGQGSRLMNNNIFVGSYKRDLKHGPAKIWKKTKSGFDKVFDGAYLDGKMNGYCYFKDEQHTFKGQINRGHYHGQCTIEYANGDHFKGTMVNGEMSGNAKITYANGDEFEGALFKNNRTGHGNYQWSTRSIADLSSKLSITKPSKEEESLTRKDLIWSHYNKKTNGILKKAVKFTGK